MLSLVVFHNAACPAALAQGVSDNVAARAVALAERLRATPASIEALEEARGFALELLRAARYEESLLLFGALRESAPGDASAHYGGALSLFNLKRVAEAELWARAAVEKAKAGAVPSPVVGLSKNGAAEAGAKVFGGEADSLVLLAVILAVKGDNGGALRAVARAAEIAPDNFDAQFTLGRAFYGAGDMASAVRAFRAAVNLKPRDAQAGFFLATALERAGDDAGALAAYRALAAAHPDVAEGHLGIGSLLVKRGGGELEEGIRELRKALALNDALYEGQVSLGRALVRSGRAAESLAPLKRAAELAPHNPEPHYQLAIAYRRLGDREAAERESAIVREIHRARRGAAAVARTGEDGPSGKP